MQGSLLLRQSPNAIMGAGPGYWSRAKLACPLSLTVLSSHAQLARFIMAPLYTTPQIGRSGAWGIQPARLTIRPYI